MDDLKKLLNTDPIAQFEKRTGKHYSENDELDDLEMMRDVFAHNSNKAAMLEASGDTTFSMSAMKYEECIREFGFQEIYSESFEVEGKPDELKVFWMKRWGLLLHYDTFMGQRNGGKVWYNWIPNQNASRAVTSSGGLKVDGDVTIWVGNHDCREALRHNMVRLNAEGEFLPVWKFQPSCMWITHHGEKDELYGRHTWNDNTPHLADIRTQERVEKFPSEVQDAIRGES